MGDWIVRLTTRLVGEAILFLILVLALTASAGAQGAAHRAGVIIRFGDGRVVSRCVSFSEPTLSGIELLTRAGLSIRVDASSSIGAGVCKIEREGCDQGKSCFCQCEGSSCAYWQYFHMQNGAWKYSNLGAALHPVAEGAVEGWAWGNNVAPPVMSLDQICAASTASAAPVRVSPSATRAPENTPTITPPPPTPTARAQESAPTATATDLPTTLPTLPPASPTLASTAATSQAGDFSSLISYAVFGIIVLGLGAWLVIQAKRVR
jgi:hypothetical protein